MIAKPFPRGISDDATSEELGAYLGDLLDWLTLQRRPDLTLAGFGDADLFSLRRVAQAYRTNTLSPEVMGLASALFGKLDKLDIQL